ncbi:hypothetical protein [Campylobacter ureolyticus]|uniref:hypothetical protein n=1 Tax=Campylobacter ureolyticus TaxID=827 RepID=UPI00290B7690|nr:hypothetical protein [Campylobacter ureolyticus]MDU5326700.1 hypothetical protein [Campylobacter ureolyticus]
MKKIIIKIIRNTGKESFFEINGIISGLLLIFFIFCFAFYFLSIKTQNTLRLDEMNKTIGVVKDIQLLKINGYHRLFLKDANSTMHIFYFTPDLAYNELINKKVIIYSITTYLNPNEMKQITLENGNVFLKYNYEKEKVYIDFIKSDFYKSVYFKWGFVALMLFIFHSYCMKYCKKLEEN